MSRVLVFIAIVLLSLQSARADINDDTQRLVISKLQAAASVRAVKAHFKPTRSEYKTAKEKYAAAQGAYNSYGATLLDNYKLGVKKEPDRLAQLASSKEEDFKTYVAGLKIQKGVGAVFLALPVLIEIVTKVYQYIDQRNQDEREKTANAKMKEITWPNWDEIS